jgi:TM2 domain-containing membrane protein YozV
MNCANHPDRERAAFCQNCGKPVCSECVRNIGSSTYCEPCLTARVGATAPPGGFPYPGYPYPGNPQPGPVGYPPVAPPASVGEPSPGLAALLGFIPGVGAMYNGQYAKGIVHLIVFAVLVSLADNFSGIFGLFIAGWIFYMVIEAHHTASARRDGTPLPNPFGLNDLSERLGFGKAWPGGAQNATPTDATPYPPPASHVPDARPVVGGDTFFHQAADGSQTYSAPGAHFRQAADGSQTYSAPGVPPVSPVPPMATAGDVTVPYYRRFPSGAVWLILLGVLFLVGDTGIFHIFHHPVFWPVFLIAVGVWVFVHKMIVTGPGLENDGTEYYRWRFARSVRCAFWVVLVGVMWLLDVLGILSWNHSWPLFLIAWGVMLLFKRTLHWGYGFAGHEYGGNGASPGPSGSAPSGPTVPGSGAMPSDPSQGPTSSDSGGTLHDDPEGR